MDGGPESGIRLYREVRDEQGADNVRLDGVAFADVWLVFVKPIVEVSRVVHEGDGDGRWVAEVEEARYLVV